MLHVSNCTQILATFQLIMLSSLNFPRTDTGVEMGGAAPPPDFFLYIAIFGRGFTTREDEQLEVVKLI